MEFFKTCFVTWRATGHYFQVPLVFDNFVQWKGLGLKKKTKLPFLRIFDNPLSKHPIFKRISTCNCCFGLFTKIIKRSGTSFWCTFSTWFFPQKCSLFDTTSMDKVSMSYLFPSQDIKQNVLLSSCSENWWRHEV